MVRRSLCDGARKTECGLNWRIPKSTRYVSVRLFQFSSFLRHSPEHVVLARVL